ncbi:MAG: YcaO-like family protein [Prevotellaceae bacterium]|nr:YcaO-like family protein [Prevotellaceae bacterium]
MDNTKMIPKRKKPYKADTPENTISNIRNILNKLDIQLKETSLQVADGLHSSRVVIENNNLLPFDIGTSGKGIQFEYSLASAYGEFMERLQNLKLTENRKLAHISNWEETDTSEFNTQLKNNDLLHKYKYAPDEQIVVFSKEFDLIRKYIHPYDIHEIEDYYAGKPLTLLPFYSVFEEKVVNLPIEIIQFTTYPNGMGAGNTPIEAILHGLSEILERYVVKLIYKNNLTFPSIPIEYFKNTEIHTIIKLIEKKHNWRIEVKDCSCELGLPVIGILIVDEVNQKYKFHLGADPSPITALERSLTELYQHSTEIALMPIDIQIQTQLLTDDELKEFEFFESVNMNMGYHPISLLSQYACYEFKGVDPAWGISDESDVKMMIDIFKKLESDVYIRDVSFLGFPSYFIHVPNISECQNVFTNKHFNKLMRHSEKLHKIARNVDVNDTKNLRFLLDYLLSYIPLKKFYNTHDLWNFYDPDLLYSLIFNHIGEKNKAVYYINEYLNKSEKDATYTFFCCYRDSLIYEKADKAEILSIIYPQTMVNEVLEFANDGNFIKQMHHSTCFNCEKCKIKSTCFLLDSLKLSKRIESEYIKNTPDQNKLANLFIWIHNPNTP